MQAGRQESDSIRPAGQAEGRLAPDGGKKFNSTCSGVAAHTCLVHCPPTPCHTPWLLLCSQHTCGCSATMKHSLKRRHRSSSASSPPSASSRRTTCVHQLAGS